VRDSFIPQKEILGRNSVSFLAWALCHLNCELNKKRNWFDFARVTYSKRNKHKIFYLIYEFFVTMETPLIIAAKHGGVEITRMLLDHGANVNIARMDLVTPIFMAAQENHVEVLKMLIKGATQKNVRTWIHAQTIAPHPSLCQCRMDTWKMQIVGEAARRREKGRWV
jgi:hypothetical protein